MDKKANKIKLFFFGSMGSLSMMSSVFLLIPSASKLSLKGENWLILLVGLLFWCSLLCGCLLLSIANAKRRRLLNNSQRSGIKNWGALKLCSNNYARVADALLLIALIGLLICIVFFPDNDGIFLFITATVFSFNMHCLLNGENFKYVLTLNK